MPLPLAAAPAVPWLLTLLEAIGLSYRAARTLAFITKFARKSQTFIHNKFVQWFSSVILAALKGEDGLEWAHDIIKDAIYKAYGIDIDELTKEEMLDAAGRVVADEMHKKIYDRYGLEFPIENVRSETLVEDLGIWFADIMNVQVSARLGYEVEPFTTFLPADELPQQIDAFVSEGLTNALGVQVDSVLDIDSVKSQLSSAFFGNVTVAVNEAFHVIKSDLTEALELMIDNSSIPQTARPAVHALMVEIINKYAVDVNNLLPENIRPKKFYYSPSKRLYNKLRQRKYRKTHKQVTHWEERIPANEGGVISILNAVANNNA